MMEIVHNYAPTQMEVIYVHVALAIFLTLAIVLAMVSELQCIFDQLQGLPYFRRQ